MLLYFDDHVEGLGNVVAFAGDANGVEDGREMAGLKLDVEHWADDLDHVTDRCGFLW
jgi:hypothetical protein